MRPVQRVNERIPRIRIHHESFILSLPQKKKRLTWQLQHHPVTGVPSFFVHPCMLGDAMAHFDCPKEDYLMVWLGLVGGPVGLWVPQEIAMA